MGRRHLSRAAALVSSLVLLAAPAAAAVQWRVLARGAAAGATVPVPQGYVALTRAATAAFAARLGAAAKARLAGVDFSRQALVAVLAEFGCRDGLIDVASVSQRARTLLVRLVERAPAPGTVQCQALFPTYRLLSIDRGSLVRPYPTRAAVTVARP